MAETGDENFQTPVAQQAAAFKEIFDTYVAAGFTNEQALRIVMRLLVKAEFRESA